MKNVTLLLLCLGVNVFSFAQINYTVNSLVVLEKKSKEKAINEENTQIIPFNLVGGLVMVDTEINGQSTFCIFDTGAPSILINKDQDLINPANGVAVGVTGRMKMKSIIVRNFAFGKLRKKNIEGIEIDISHIEKLKKRPIHGIIGVGAYKKEEVLINYKSQEIELLPRKHKKKIGAKERIASVPFYMEDQLPVIKIKIGKKNYYFGVDTGAEVNVMDQRLAKKLKRLGLKPNGEKKLAGVGQSKHNAQTAIIDQFKIKKQTFENEEFVFMDLSQFNQSYGMKLDGILGFPFLQKNLISFDFRHSKLNFWK